MLGEVPDAPLVFPKAQERKGTVCTALHMLESLFTSIISLVKGQVLSHFPEEEVSLHVLLPVQDCTPGRRQTSAGLTEEQKLGPGATHSLPRNTVSSPERHTGHRNTSEAKASPEKICTPFKIPSSIPRSPQRLGACSLWPHLPASRRTSRGGGGRAGAAAQLRRGLAARAAPKAS